MNSFTDFRRVRLSEDDFKKCQSLAHERNDSNRDGGYTSRKVSTTDDDFTIDMQGVIGEAAFLIDNDLPLSMISVDKPGGDLGWDFRLENGKTIDVKLNPVMLNHSAGDLIRKNLKKKASIYFLVWWVEPRVIDLIGVIGRERFDRERVDMPTGIGFKVPWTTLKSVQSLYDWPEFKICR